MQSGGPIRSLGGTSTQIGQSMIRLEVSGPSASMTTVAEEMDKIDGVSRVMCVETTPPGNSIVSAVVRPLAVDQLLAEIRRLEVPDDEVALTRIESLAPKVSGRRGPQIIWADVVAQARQNAKMGPRRLVFVTVAGVIGCYGVVDANAILIVGAMAISPDLLPITATGVGVASGQLGIARRGLITLTPGNGGSSRCGGALRPGSESTRPASLRIQPQLVVDRPR